MILVRTSLLWTLQRWSPRQLPSRTSLRWVIRCRGFPDAQRKVPGPVEGRYRHSEDKASFTQGSPGIVTLRGGSKRPSFYDGDLVMFSDIEGMVELNSHSPQPVRVQSKLTLLQPLPQLCENNLYLGGVIIY